MSFDAYFHEVRFPTLISFGATGGPERLTEIVTLGSGHEVRNGRWAHARRRFDAGSGVKSLDDLSEVVAFFEARRGRLTGFRFRDPTDFQSCAPRAAPSPTDQQIGTGTGIQNTFQLVKSYGGGDAAYVRPIAKPVACSVRIAVDGVEVADDFSVDPATGFVTFAAGTEPDAGAIITAGFEFDVPVRFDADRIEISMSAFSAGEIPSIPLIEIRL